MLNIKCLNDKYCATQPVILLVVSGLPGYTGAAISFYGCSARPL